MNEGRRNPSDPREWLRRARSNLERAGVLTPNSYTEDACFDAQQAAEKAIKAVLVSHRIPFPYVHDLDRLFGVAEEAGVEIPEAVWEAGSLSQYAVGARYPGVAKPVTQEQWKAACTFARRVVEWAEQAIESTRGEVQ